MPGFLLSPFLFSKCLWFVWFLFFHDFVLLFTQPVFLSPLKWNRSVPHHIPKQTGHRALLFTHPYLPLPIRMITRVELLVQGLTEIFLVFVCTKGIFKRISAGGDVIFPSVVEAGYISLFFTHAHTAFGMIHHRQYPCRRQQLEMSHVAEGKITLKSSGIFF